MMSRQTDDPHFKNSDQLLFFFLPSDDVSCQHCVTVSLGPKCVVTGVSIVSLSVTQVMLSLVSA